MMGNLIGVGLFLDVEVVILYLMGQSVEGGSLILTVSRFLLIFV
jgi:hypothetical protein